MMSSFYHNSFGFGPLSLLSIGVLTVLGLVGFALAVIVIVLKGYSLWHAARRDEKWWFIALLLLNTLGILELCYLYFVVGKWREFPSGKDEEKPPAAPHDSNMSTSAPSDSEKK